MEIISFPFLNFHKFKNPTYFPTFAGSIFEV